MNNRLRRTPTRSSKFEDCQAAIEDLKKKSTKHLNKIIQREKTHKTSSPSSNETSNDDESPSSAKNPRKKRKLNDSDEKEEEDFETQKPETKESKIINSKVAFSKDSTQKNPKSAQKTNQKKLENENSESDSESGEEGGKNKKKTKKKKNYSKSSRKTNHKTSETEDSESDSESGEEGGKNKKKTKKKIVIDKHFASKWTKEKPKTYPDLPFLVMAPPKSNFSTSETELMENFFLFSKIIASQKNSFPT